MLVTLVTLAAFAADTRPATLNNAGNGDLNMLSVGHAEPGEEGHWMAVKFEAHQHDLGVTSIDATFVRQPAGPTWDNVCSTDFPHDVVVFTSADPMPPADPDILYRATIPASTGPYGRVPLHLDLPEEIFVPKGEYLYVSFEMAGQYPNVTCMMLSSDTEDKPAYRESEYWSFATAAPFPWEGLDPYWNSKVVASVSGVWYL